MDLATGSAGFLISAMEIMINQAETKFAKGSSKANAEIEKGSSFDKPDKLYFDFKATKLLLNPPFSYDEIDAKIIKQRVYSLLVVFGVLNLFCIAFNQNGLALTLFARDYTELRYWGVDFSKISTFFVILATPIVLTIFSTLRVKGREPSTLKKMAIGMGVAAVAYLVMTLGSINLPKKTDLIVFSETQRVIPFLLGTYFILAIAELLVYPLLSSFISQFARPKHQGIMQSVCSLAAVIGNYLLFLGAIMYERIPILATWLIFVTICLISMIVLLLILKRVEKTMKNETNNAST